jgi:uncharacterized protein
MEYMRRTIVQRLTCATENIRHCRIACSGGIDSLLLAYFLSLHNSGGQSIVVHAMGPAVPADATERVKRYAARFDWELQLINADEFGDEFYRRNDSHRCFHCKNRLYSAINSMKLWNTGFGFEVVSGTNLDDLDEYRPGLAAAKEWKVRHPFLEASLRKADIRILANHFGLPDWNLPASPCLASRLYTGTEVTLARLSAVELSEGLIRSRRGIEIVRCRLRGDEMLVEVTLEDQAKIDSNLLDDVFAVVAEKLPQIGSVRLDPQPYKSGRAFLVQAAEYGPAFG